jgi:hypothetical protein
MYYAHPTYSDACSQTTMETMASGYHYTTRWNGASALIGRMKASYRRTGRYPGLDRCHRNLFEKENRIARVEGTLKH